jgi:glycerol-3-phosphate acyltransferase PlsY
MRRFRVIVKTALFLGLCYIVGGIPTGYLLVRIFKGSDIRAQGSGNIGFSNVARTAGVPLGIAVLAIDAGKAYAAVRLFSAFFEQERLFTPLLGSAVIAGNILNPFLGFRGGKGVATGLGACLAVSPVALLCAVGVFGCVLAAWRYISLGSIAAAAVFFAASVVLLRRGPADLAALAFSAVVFAAVTARHASNIGRLIRGEENRIGRRR